MIDLNTNRNQIVGQIGPDGKPIGLLDAMMGVRPPMNPNPFNVPAPSPINYNDLTRELGAQPMPQQQGFNLMNTFRNLFDMPKTTSSVVDGQNITETVMPNVTDQAVENAVAEAGGATGNPLAFMNALSGLLNTPQQQFMPMVQQQATPGLDLQTTDLNSLYGGILNG